MRDTSHLKLVPASLTENKRRAETDDDDDDDDDYSDYALPSS